MLSIYLPNQIIYLVFSLYPKIINKGRLKSCSSSKLPVIIVLLYNANPSKLNDNPDTNMNITVCKLYNLEHYDYLCFISIFCWLKFPNWMFFPITFLLHLHDCVWLCKNHNHTEASLSACCDCLASGALITSCCLDQCWSAAGGCEGEFISSSVLVETKQTSIMWALHIYIEYLTKRLWKRQSGL